LVSYLLVDCSEACPSWEYQGSIYKEEYKQELEDNCLYYGNKDSSAEDIFHGRATLGRKKPEFILPSYQALNPTTLKRIGASNKKKSDLEEQIDTEELVDSNILIEPDSLAESYDVEVNPDAVFSSRLESRKLNSPASGSKWKR
jgi:hypothetical protein